MSWGELTPYLLLIVIGFLPNEAWRILGLVLVRGLRDDSQFILLARAVATAILAGVVAKLIFVTGGALATIPLAVRIGAAAGGFLAYRLIKRSILAGVLAGEALLVLGGFIYS
jgi:hypothetical protein